MDFFEDDFSFPKVGYVNPLEVVFDDKKYYPSLKQTSKSTWKDANPQKKTRKSSRPSGASC